MNKDEWQRVRELFEGVLDVEPPARAEWLRGQAAAPAVKAEVESLIEHHTRAGAFLEEPVAERLPGLFEEDGALDPGSMLGHYKVVREIGRGSMGRVYLAEDVNLGRVVALKALAPQFTGDPSYRERLRREARAAAGMTHPGICTVYALEESDAQLFIVSEFIEGHTLREEVAHHQAPGAEAIAATARELADALAAAHANGITHRDFKPENVMRDRTGRLKVLDFGLAYSAEADGLAAQHLAMNTLPGVLVGTPAYMAPEQLNGQRADARSDVFAYGVVMYEYACGVHPFGASTPLGLLARVLESDASPIGDRTPHVPGHVAMVVDRCLRKSAADRFASAGEIVTALQTGSRGTSTSRRAAGASWWRAHQVVMMVIYLAAGLLAWAVKEAFREPLPLWLFIAIGIWAVTGGTVRAHLLFTSGINPLRLRDEHLRVRRTLRALDLLIAAGLGVDGLSIASIRPLWGVLTVGLAAGIALATLLMEPATSATFFE
jgi:predicted Ser/Thr protein kinase